MPVLYEFPPTRSQRAKWALEELGIEYSSQIINLPGGQQNSSNYRAVHPLGFVPITNGVCLPARSWPLR